MEIPSLRVQVEPLLMAQSASSPFAHQTARANSSLWNCLGKTKRREIERRDNNNRVCVALKWPKDCRLRRGKGKEKSTVVWVEEGEDKVLILRSECERVIVVNVYVTGTPIYNIYTPISDTGILPHTASDIPLCSSADRSIFGNPATGG